MFNFKLLRMAKYESSIHYIDLSREKAILSESGEKYAQIQHRLQVKTVKTMWEDNRELEEHHYRCNIILIVIIFLCIHIFFARSNRLKLKHINLDSFFTNMQLLLQNILFDGMEWCG